MKKYFSFIVLTLVALGASAQTFNALKYQAIARNADGGIITNRDISLKFELVDLQNDQVLYSELHQVEGNSTGLINLDIGLGEPLFNRFDQVAWEQKNIGIRTYIDLEGNYEFDLLGTETLRSVPYAMHAQTADRVIEGVDGTENFNNDAPFWHTYGNDRTDPDVNFLGTRDAQDLVLRTSNIERVRLTSTGELVVLNYSWFLHIEAEYIDVDHIQIGSLAHILDQLQVDGNAQFDSEVSVDGHTDLQTLEVQGTAVLKNDLNVFGNTTFDQNVQINDQLTVDGLSHFKNNVEINLNANIRQGLDVAGQTRTGSALVESDLNVQGMGVFQDDIQISQDAHIGNDLNVQNQLMTHELNVSGESRFNDKVQMDQDLLIRSNLQVDGNTNMQNTTIGSEMTVSGPGLFEGDLTINNDVEIGNDLQVGNQLNANELLVDHIVSQDLHVEGNGLIDGNLSIGHDVLAKNITTGKDLTIGGEGSFTSNVSIGNDLHVAGEGEVNGNLTIADDLIAKKITANEDLNVEGTGSFSGDVSVGNNLHVSNQLSTNQLNAQEFITQSLRVEGDGLMGGDLIVENDISTKNISTSENLNVQNDAFVDHDLKVDGKSKFSGKIAVGSANFSGDEMISIKGSNESHIMMLENTNSDEGDGIAIKLGRSTTSRKNHFLSFISGDDYLAGRIEGYDIATDFTDFPMPSQEAWEELGCLYLNVMEITNPVLLATKGVWDLGIVPLWNDVAEIPELTIDKGAIFEGIDFPNIEVERSEIASWNWGSIGISKGDLFDETIAGVEFKVPESNYHIWNPPAVHIPSSDINLASLPDVPELPTNDFNILPKFDFSSHFGELEHIPNLTEMIPGCPDRQLEFFPNPNLDIVNTYPKIYDYSFYLSEFLQANNATTLIPGGFKPQDFGIAFAKWGITTAAKHQGVTYGSEGADYAEWLPKSDSEEEMMYGQIVGVKNGEISLNTDDADQIMSISLAPAVVGNLPLEEEKEKYEMVGFMGQVPIWVIGGCKSGDYIIPTGHHDGYGKAIAAEDLKVEHMSQILGRALEDSKTGIIDLVNTIIGVKTNEWAQIFRQQEDRIVQLEEQVQSLSTIARQVRELQTQMTKVHSSNSRTLPADNQGYSASTR